MRSATNVGRLPRGPAALRLLRGVVPPPAEQGRGGEGQQRKRARLGRLNDQDTVDRCIGVGIVEIGAGGETPGAHAYIVEDEIILSLDVNAAKVRVARR